MVEIEDCTLLGPSDGVNPGDLINITVELDLTTDAPYGSENVQASIIANGEGVGVTEVEVPADGGLTTTIFSESLVIMTEDFAEAGDTVDVEVNAGTDTVYCGSFDVDTLGSFEVTGGDLISPAGVVSPNAGFNVSADVYVQNTTGEEQSTAIGLAVDGITVDTQTIYVQPGVQDGEATAQSNQLTIDNLGGVSPGDSVDVQLETEFGNYDIGSFSFQEEEETNRELDVFITDESVNVNEVTIEFMVENTGNTQEVIDVQVSPGNDSISYVLDPGDSRTGQFIMTFNVEQSSQQQITVTIPSTGDTDSEVVTVHPPQDGGGGGGEEPGNGGETPEDGGSIISDPLLAGAAALGIGAIALSRRRNNG